MHVELNKIELTLVKHEEEIPQAVEHLNNQNIVAVDTESNSLYVYHEKVCLIQFSTTSEHFVFDTLALPELPQLAPLFSNPKIQKIFHAAEYDVLCLKRDYGYQFRNIFDTMIAAKILGKENIGLAALVESELGFIIEKKYQKANWGIRPIPNEMLTYAVHDTSFLIPLKQKLEAALIENNLMEIAVEDFERLTKIPPGTSCPEMTNWWNAAGTNAHMTHQQMTILQNLCEWREKIAQQMDQPTFKILQNQTLVSLATEQPQTTNELKNFTGFRKSLLSKHGRELLRIIKNEQPRGKCPQPIKKTTPPAEMLKRRDAIHSWRKETGIKHGVPSDVILPKDVMNGIIQKNPKNEAELQAIMKDVPWRFNRFSADLLKTLKIYNE